MRFPGFEGEWEEKNLGELLDFKNGINASKEDYGFGYKFINVLDIIENDIITYDKIKGEVNVSESIFEKNLVQYGDILFQRSSETRKEVGQSNVYLDKNKTATFGGFVIRGRKISDYQPFFLHILLKSSIARKEIMSKSGGSTRYNVGQEVLASVQLSLPNFDEQKHIATFIWNINQRIKTQNEIIDNLESLKMGLCQKTFSQLLRFRDEIGEEFPNWEKTSLGNLLIEINNKSTKSDQFPILSSTTKGLFNQSDYFTRDIASKNNAGYKILKMHQLVFSPQNLWLGNININSDFEIGIVSPSYKIFDFNKSITTSEFCKYLLFTPRMLFEYAQASEQGASVVRRNLDMVSFKAIILKLPSDGEQTKIANFLSSIDEKIKTEKKLLDQFQNQKKYFLQNLFI